MADGLGYPVVNLSQNRGKGTGTVEAAQVLEPEHPNGNGRRSIRGLEATYLICSPSITQVAEKTWRLTPRRDDLQPS